MRLNKYQQLVLAIASVLAFAIWLFPHWRFHIHYRSENTWMNSGYAFLFLPPDVPARVKKLSEDFPGCQVGVVLDWDRQFYEWGTLVFLTGFALAGLRMCRSH